MADILKVTTPLVEKMPNSNLRPAVADPTQPFNLSDVTRVTQTHDPSELLKQNTGLPPGETDTPKILAELLSDPAVTASMIGSISMLQEIISLLPANNNALTQEIEQLFAHLLVKPGDIAAELMRQEESTTVFKGELFDQLRRLLSQNATRPEIANGVGHLLKALNALISQQDVLESVSHNLAFLAENVNSSALLSDALRGLASALRQPNASQNFPQLKQQILAVLQQLQTSVLYGPALEKTIPLVIYNLSRYNTNQEFLPDALQMLLFNMNGDDQKLELVNNLRAFLDKVLLSPGEERVPNSDDKPHTNVAQATKDLLIQLHNFHSQPQPIYRQPTTPALARTVAEESKVIDTLAKIISKQANSEEVQVLTGDKVDKIIQSLLSSPCNFTPLLHFIVPLEFENMRAFAEIWVDPNADEEEARRKGQQGDATHMLMVFEVEGVGRFEAELYVMGHTIALNLLCPPAFVEAFKDIGPNIRKAVEATSYSFQSINIDRMERTHSLMDVFTDLPHRRTGINVKV